MEETTTEAGASTGGTVIQGVQVDDQGQAIPEPEETTTASADDATNESGQEASEHDKPAQNNNSEQEQLDHFAKTKGLTLDSENAIKAAKMAMNAEKLMHEKTVRASELEKTMSGMSDDSAQQVADATGQDPEILKRVQRMEVQGAIRDFWDQNPSARQYEAEMAKIAVESGLYGTPDAILKASYAMAVANNQNAVKSQGKREALESLAHKQQAAVPTGNAVNSAATFESITSQNVDQMVASHDLDWFKANQVAINRAMAG